jgi:hypothetical protein
MQLEDRSVNTTFQQWLAQGESIYQAALKEFHAIEAQLDEFEAKLVAKQAEVNQIAQILGKPVVEASRRGTNAIVAAPVIPQIIEEVERTPTGGSNANIARALTGKFGR